MRRRISCFCTFPDARHGQARRASRSRSGSLYVASPAARSRLDHRLEVQRRVRDASTTHAQPRSPSRSSGSATTATCATSGNSLSMSSISRGAMFTPAADDDLLLAAHDRQVAVVVEAHQVARAHPAAGEIGGGRALRIVGEPDAGVRPADVQLAFAPVASGFCRPRRAPRSRCAAGRSRRCRRAWRPASRAGSRSRRAPRSSRRAAARRCPPARRGRPAAPARARRRSRSASGSAAECRRARSGRRGHRGTSSRPACSCSRAQRRARRRQRRPSGPAARACTPW